jgi:lipopolysaccharide export LptBFGC system permease protein LptF
MLLTDISPIKSLSNTDAMKLVRSVFNGSPNTTPPIMDDPSLVKEPPIIKQESSRPNTNYLFDVLLVCFLVFLSLSVGVQYRLKFNKYISFLIASLVAGFVFLVYKKICN